jgi:hypothetical protein
MERRNEVHTYWTVSLALSQPLKKTCLGPSTKPLSHVRASIAFGQNSLINSTTEWSIPPKRSMFIGLARSQTLTMIYLSAASHSSSFRLCCRYNIWIEWMVLGNEIRLVGKKKSSGSSDYKSHIYSTTEEAVYLPSCKLQIVKFYLGCIYCTYYFGSIRRELHWTWWLFLRFYIRPLRTIPIQLESMS